MSRLVDRKEACRILGITLTTLHKLTTNGTIKGFKIGGKIRYHETDIYSGLKEIPASRKAVVHGN